MSRLFIGAAVGAASLLAAAGPGWSTTPTLDEARRYALMELNRLCDDERKSRFDQVDKYDVRRSCRAGVSPGKIQVDVKYHARVDGDAELNASAPRSGEQSLAAEFDRGSRFLCGRTNQRGYAPLYLSCDAEEHLSGDQCVSISQTKFDQEGVRHERKQSLSYGLIAHLRPNDCHRMRRALMFVLKRSPRRERTIADFFSE